ncbi:helix-turn-helix domain-containing protein [Terribacillus saccharophilus]|uniref:helix-turn-helix domain-containing protein n=1 Tax=Terribacillus saccharophilus TaxID=361277 RepID=UPI001C3EFC3D|nr:helix-turn-helix transcriptional regulator [Terribacillus saccharophilus]
MKTARERSVNTNMRQKKQLAEELGISQTRLSNIEDGMSVCPLDLALEWCRAVNDRTTEQAILHIFGTALPPTHPALVRNLPSQLVNHLEQLEEGINVTRRLLQIYADARPDKPFDAAQINEIEELAVQIVDTDQSSGCVLDSMALNWNINKDGVIDRWVLKTMNDGVIVRSSERLAQIKRVDMIGTM